MPTPEEFEDARRQTAEAFSKLKDYDPRDENVERMKKEIEEYSANLERHFIPDNNPSYTYTPMTDREVFWWAVGILFIISTAIIIIGCSIAFVIWFGKWIGAW